MNDTTSQVFKVEKYKIQQISLAKVIINHPYLSITDQIESLIQVKVEYLLHVYL